MALQAGAAGLAGLLLAVAIPAVARSAEQAPGNAHRFLAQLAGRGGMRFEPAKYYMETKFYSLAGIAIASDTKCLTKAAAFDTSGEDHQQEAPEVDRHGTVPGTERWRWYLPHLRAMNERGIDRSRVKSSEASGDTVLVRGTGLSGGYIKLLFDSSDMAARAAYAIEAIRRSFDPVAGTGF